MATLEADHATGSLEVAVIEIIREIEGVPSSYPAKPSGLSTAADALDSALIWRRLEHWTRYRWAEREVVWTLEGPGNWEPRLTPATVTSFEVWRNGAWVTVTLTASPIGYLLEDDTYRLTATVGDTDAPPEVVLEAYTRLAEYFAEIQADPLPALTSTTDGDFSFSRPSAWAAKALFVSGAADLLRAFR